MREMVDLVESKKLFNFQHLTIAPGESAILTDLQVKCWVRGDDLQHKHSHWSLYSLLASQSARCAPSNLARIVFPSASRSSVSKILQLLVQRVTVRCTNRQVAALYI